VTWHTKMRPSLSTQTKGGRESRLRPRPRWRASPRRPDHRGARGVAEAPTREQGPPRGTGDI